MARKKQINSTITIENAQVQFRNFTGKEGKYNREGDRNFVVFLDPEDAEPLAKDGWLIKELKPRDPGDHPQQYLPVKVAYGNYPPKIVVITDAGQKILDEDTVHILDWAEFANVDMIINPYNWEVSGDTGVKAYLKTMYVTIVEDEIEKKYADVPRNVRPEDDFED